MTYIAQSRPRQSISAQRKTLWSYLDLYRQRRALERLDSHLLRDIGISTTEAKAEANRPIWDAPQHWLR